MDLFRKLHGRLERPGLELKILRRLPIATLFAVLLPASVAVLVRVVPHAPEVNAAKLIKTVDIFMIATGITFLTAVFTVAIGAILVHIMKGPAYVAGAYPLSHADRPSQRSSWD